MKTKIYLAGVVSIAISGLLNAQNVGINTTGATPNSSSQLDLNTGNTFTSPNGKGLLIPNVSLNTTADNTTVPVGASQQSLLVYNTNNAITGTGASGKGYYWWDNTSALWINLVDNLSPGAPWLTNGNAGTTASTAAIGSTANNNFIGTTDANNFVQITNGKEVGRYLSSGTENMVINSTTAASNDIFSSYSSAAGNSIAGYNTSATVKNTANTFPPAGSALFTTPSAVYGKASSLSGFGVFGINVASTSTSTTTIGAGVYGETAAQNGYGIWGVNSAAASTAAPLATAIYGASPNGGYGTYGYSTGGSTTSLFSAGTFGFNGSIYGGAGVTGAAYSAGNVGYFNIGVLGTNDVSGGAPLYTTPPGGQWSMGVMGVGLGITGKDIGGFFYSANQQHSTNGGGWSIYSSGAAASTVGWYTVSDENLKENIKPIASSLQKLLTLNGYTYNFKQTVSDEYQHQEIGFLSQDVERLFPQLVSERAFIANKKEYITDGKNKEPKEDPNVPKTAKFLNYTGLIPVLVEALKEQQQQIEDLKTEIKALKKSSQK